MRTSYNLMDNPPSTPKKNKIDLLVERTDTGKLCLVYEGKQAAGGGPVAFENAKAQTADYLSELKFAYGMVAVGRQVVFVTTDASEDVLELSLNGTNQLVPNKSHTPLDIAKDAATIQGILNAIVKIACVESGTAPL